MLFFLSELKFISLIPLKEEMHYRYPERKGIQVKVSGDIWKVTEIFTYYKQTIVVLKRSRGIQVKVDKPPNLSSHPIGYIEIFDAENWKKGTREFEFQISVFENAS